MSDESPDLAERALLRRKREDTARAVPALGVMLLVSPFLNIFAGLDRVFGLPVVFVYVFGVWLWLILLTRTLARRLMPSRDR